MSLDARKWTPLGFLLLVAALCAGPPGAQTVLPQLIGVEPKSAVTTPGTKVTVSGFGFSEDAIAYFGGLQVRKTTFISPSQLEVVTPYLRPGKYQIQLQSGGATIRPDVDFTALPSRIDAEIDLAADLAKKGQPPAAISLLAAIAKTNNDYQVQAFAYYQIGEIYFALGDWWRWGGESYGIFDNAAKSGRAVQTSWRYGLAVAKADYFLPTNTQPDHDLKLADWTVERDVTQHPEPRFHRGLVNARYGNLQQAKADADFILKLEPGNPSYRALAAYVAVLGGDKTRLESFSGESLTDARALGLLGEAAYLSGDAADAQRWWMLAAKENPLGAGLAFLAGKKHLARGHKRIAAALLTQCTLMAPNSKEAKEARELLAKLGAPASFSDPMRYWRLAGMWSRHRWLAFVRCGVLCLTVAPIAQPQGEKPDAASVAVSLKRVTEGDFHAGDVERLARAGATQGVPALRKQFVTQKDTLLKGFIASALVRLGAKEEPYWEFLVEHARAAAENDAPSIFLLDSQGRIVRGHGQFSPEFLEWAKANNLDAGAAAQAQLYELPIHFGHLAKTGDPRGLALLQKGLASHNFTIQAMAARGLAKLQDKGSIPLIIEACRKAHPEMSPFIARALVFFDDPRAQSAAEMFISDKQVLEEIRKYARQKGADPFMF